MIILSDGYRDLDAKLFLADTPDKAEAVRATYPSGKTRNSLNVFLIISGKRVALVDTGGGSVLGPDAGRLPQALAAAGVSPADVTDIILTHAHRDHIGGLAPQGVAAFPNAWVHISKAEHDYWTSPDNEAKASERAKPNFALLREMLALYPWKVSIFEPGKELMPGVSTIATPGHTPGHVALLVSSKEDTLLLWGDLLHGMELQLPRPDISIAFDTDPLQAAVTRSELLQRAAIEKWRVSGVHVPAPAAYRIKAAGGFVLLP